MTKKYKRVELKELINDSNFYINKLTINNRNRYVLILIFDFYKRYYNTILTYEGVNLDILFKRYKNVEEKEYIRYSWEEVLYGIYKAKRKKLNKLYSIPFVALGLSMIPLADATIYSNVVDYNTSYILNNFAYYENEGEVLEIDLEEAASYDGYKTPKDDSFYRVTNPFDKNTYDVIFDGSAANASINGSRLYCIKINGEYYTSTGKIAFFDIKTRDYTRRIIFPEKFETEEEAINFYKDLLEYHYYLKEYDDITYLGSRDTKTMAELPNITLDKENDNIKIKEKVHK